jgi:hypothetical protein
VTSPPLPRVSTAASGSDAEATPALSSPSLRRSANLSADEYVAEYKIDELLAKLRSKLVTERPEDPLTFLSTFIDHLLMHNKFILEREDVKSPSADAAAPVVPTISRRLSKEFFQVTKHLNLDDGGVTSPTAAQSFAEGLKDLIAPPSAGPSPMNANAKSEDDHSVGLIQKSLTLVKNGSQAPDQGSIESKSMLGLDIGGSLAKIVFFEPLDTGSHTKEAHFVKKSFKYGFSGVRDAQLGFNWKNGKFHFLHFETRRLDNAVQLLKSNGLFRNEKFVPATGGGSQKFASVIRKEFNCKLAKGDELACLLVGINFLLRNVPDELYFLEDVTNPKCQRLPFDHADGTFPYILGN